MEQQEELRDDARLASTTRSRMHVARGMTLSRQRLPVMNNLRIQAARQRKEAIRRQEAAAELREQIAEQWQRLARQQEEGGHYKEGKARARRALRRPTTASPASTPAMGRCTAPALPRSRMKLASRCPNRCWWLEAAG